MKVKRYRTEEEKKHLHFKQAVSVAVSGSTILSVCMPEAVILVMFVVITVNLLWIWGEDFI
jgi:hypothetical protein